jgi:hypothetical protein
MVAFNLCTLQEIKTRIDSSNVQVKDAAALQKIIPNVSADIEEYLRRDIEEKAYTQVFDVENNLVFFLKAYPVTAITDVRFATDWDFDTSSIVDMDAYSTEKLEAGVLKFLPGYLWNGIRALQVNYTGGIATDQDDLKNSNEGRIINEAAILECCFRARTRHVIGAESEVVGDAGSVTWQRGGRFLREVEAMLKPLRKVV